MASNPTGEAESHAYPDEYIGQPVVPCAAVSTGLAAALVGLRFYTRGVILRRLGLPDWFILVSLVFAIGSMSGTIAMVEFGLGRHRIYLSEQMFTQYLKANFASSVLYVASLVNTKLSILSLYLHILTDAHTRTATKALIAVVVLSHAYIIANLLASCVPLRAFWNFPLRRTSYCHSKEIYWSNYILHVATDFLIFFLPLPVIFKLKIPRRQKIPLAAVFLAAFTYARPGSHPPFHFSFTVLTAGSVCAISVLRMVMFVNSNRNGDAADFTFTTTSMASWSMIEICASIACACLPTLKPLLARAVPTFCSRAGLPGDWQGEVPGYERPLTIGTARERRGANMDGDGDMEDREEIEGEGRSGWRRASFASCSDGMSEKRDGMNEVEFEGPPWSGHQGREGMESPTGSERPLRPVLIEKSAHASQW